MKAHAKNWFDPASDLKTALLGGRINGQPIDFGQLPCGNRPLDINAHAMDNSGTLKALVGRTYAGVDGYYPLVADPGTESYCLDLALRPGTEHSASQIEYPLKRIVPMATRMAPPPLLVRANSGFCSLKLMQAITATAHERQQAMIHIIQWSPRTMPVKAIADKQ